MISIVRFTLLYKEKKSDRFLKWGKYPDAC